MENVTQARKEALSGLFEALEHTLVITQSYADTFKTSDFFTLSISAERVERYKSDFSRFCVELTEALNVADGFVARAYELLIRADRELLFGEVELLQATLDAYEALSASISDFFKLGRRSLFGDSPTITSLVEGAKRISLAINNLLKIEINAEL